MGMRKTPRDAADATGKADDRAHQQGCADGDDRDRALEVAEPHVDEFDERFKKAAAQHELAGKYEKRYCEEREAVHASVHFYRKLDNVEVCRKQVDHSGDKKVVCDWQADDHQRQEAYDHQYQ